LVAVFSGLCFILASDGSRHDGNVAPIVVNANHTVE
jgi:hypothetical protein